MQMSAGKVLNELKIIELNIKNNKNELKQMESQRSLLILRSDTSESIDESGSLSSSNLVCENHAESTPHHHASKHKRMKLDGTQVEAKNRGNGEDQSHSRHENSGNGTNESCYKGGNLSYSNFVFENQAPQEKSTPFNHAQKHGKVKLDVTQVKEENRTNGQDQSEINDRVSHNRTNGQHQSEVNDRVSHSRHDINGNGSDESFDESDSISENRQTESSSPINVRKRLKRLNPKSKKSPRKIKIKKEHEAAKLSRREQSEEWRTGEFQWIKFSKRSKFLPGFILPESEGILCARSITLKGTISLDKFVYYKAEPNIFEKLKDIRYKRALHKFNVENGQTNT